METTTHPATYDRFIEVSAYHDDNHDDRDDTNDIPVTEAIGRIQNGTVDLCPDEIPAYLQSHVGMDIGVYATKFSSYACDALLFNLILEQEQKRIISATIGKIVRQRI